MSFFDNPKIDKSSERSEKSVNATRCLFTKESGFILREENPDYGVDFDVELIENKEASRNKFAIQIKSSHDYKTTIIDNQNFLVLDFLTSRLGYIARNNPGLGLIVIYNEKTTKLYFDYIEEIIERINSNKRDAIWLNQEKVRIHIPLQNELNLKRISLIYDKFFQAHKNHYSLLQNHSKDYNIPFVNIDNSGNVFNEDKLLKMLEEYGIYLFNNLKFSELFNAISRLSYQEISHNYKLSFLAALVYAEIGKPIDSNMFIQYFEINNTGLSNSLNDIIEFTKFKNDFLLGKRDFKQYIEDLKILADKSEIEQNTLTININISLLKVMSSMEDREIDKSLLNEFKDLHSKIDNSKLDERVKHLLNIFQAENYQACALKVLSESILNQQLKENLGVYISQKERIENANQLHEMLSYSINYVQKALDYAILNDDKLLKAHAYHKIASFFFGRQFDTLIHRIELKESKSFEILDTCFNYAIQGYNFFLELNQYNDAHIALCLAYEIKNLALLQFHKDIGNIDLQSLNNIIRRLENEIGKRKFSSAVDMFFQAKEKRNDATLIDLTDEEINFFAKSILKARGLPENRLENLVQDIKNRQFFETHCDNDKYILHQNNVIGEDIYTYPTDYKIIQKENNLLIGKGINLQKLIFDLGLMIK